MVEHFFHQEDDFAYLTEGSGGFENREKARAEIGSALPGATQRGAR